MGSWSGWTPHSRPRRALAENEVLQVLLANYMHEANSADLRTKSKRALKAILKKCTHLP